MVAYISLKIPHPYYVVISYEASHSLSQHKSAYPLCLIKHKHILALISPASTRIRSRIEASHGGQQTKVLYN